MCVTNAVKLWSAILDDTSKPLKARFRALFALKNVGGAEAIKAICQCFKDDSALLKHELAYCLGQMKAQEATDFLVTVLQNQSEDAMVRHEAGEALGAIGMEKLVPVLKECCKDERREVAQTCELAVKRIQWIREHPTLTNTTSGAFQSVDPAPASEMSDVRKLEECLLDSSECLWDRYRAMFALRNLNNPPAIKSLAKGLSCMDSALFRHEVAYVLGQLQSPLCIDELTERLRCPKENYMVRHECAESLGSIGGDKVIQILSEFLKDENRVVRESCEVAVDMAEYEMDDAQLQFTHSLHA